MFDIGWPEFFLAAAVALIAVGPNELPGVMHKLGMYAGKIRRFIYVIQHDFDRLTHEAAEIEAAKEKSKKDD